MTSDQSILPEHSATPSDPTKEVEMSQEEKEAVRLAEKIFTKNKRARAKYDKEWNTYFKYFRGEQWRQKRPSYRHSEVVNITTASIRNMIPILTDPQPQVQTTPEDPSDFEFSEIMNQVISSKWDKDTYNMIVAECLIDAAVMGTGIGHVPWVPELDKGIGDYTFETTDPAHIFPDPSSRDTNDRRGKTFCVAEPVDVQELREEYPDKKEKIKPDLSEAISFTSYNDDAQEFAFKSPVDNRMMQSESKAGNNANPDLALKLTVYVMSDDVVTSCEKSTDPQTGVVTEVEKHVKKYPNGRKIVTACGLLLEDAQLEYDDGKYPYARLVNDIIPRSFWGEGEIGPLKSPQDITNKLISYFMDYMIITGNPHWVIDSEAQVDVDNITNEPGMIIVKKKGGEARQEPGISPPAYLINTMQYFMGDVASKISGQNEISQGALTKANLSGEAISQLTEASQTRLRAKARNLDAFLSQIGFLMCSRILQYYSLPRVVRITNQTDAAPKYFKFMVEKDENETLPDGTPNPNQGNKVATYSEYMPNEMGGGTFGTPKKVPLKSELDIRISTGTALPFMKAKRDSQAERLFDKGVLDAEDFLDTIEYPKREQIIAKWKQRQQQAAAANAQQGQPTEQPEAVGG